MADIRTMKLNLLADVANFTKGMATADLDAKGLSTNVTKYGKVMAKAFAVAAAAAAAFAVKIGVDAIKSASDLNEEISKSEVIFGDGADEIKKFAETAAKALGQTQTEALKGASNFAILGKAAGLTGKDLTGFSIKSTKLASDLGSFFNTKAEDAINAIGSALRGEAEPIRKYGVLISAAAVDTAAYNYEIRTGTELERDKKNQLTETSKVLARYQSILDQTADAQGDFARTSDGLANQQKILTAEIENAKASFGVVLLPVMQSVVGFISDKFIPIIRDVSDAITGQNSTGLSSKVRALARDMDGQGKSGGTTLGESLVKVADAFGNLYAAIVDPRGEKGTSILENLASALEAVASGLNAIAKIVGYGKGLSDFLKNPLDLYTTPSGGVKRIPQGAFQGFASGGTVMGNTPVRVGEFGPEIFYPGGKGGSIRSGGGGGNTIININGVIDAESARRSIEKLLQNSARRTSPINLIGATL